MEEDTSVQASLDTSSALVQVATNTEQKPTQSIVGTLIQMQTMSNKVNQVVSFPNETAPPQKLSALSKADGNGGDQS